MNDDVSTYRLLGQMAVRQEGATHRKFKFTHRNKHKHSQANLRLLIKWKIHDVVHSHSSLCLCGVNSHMTYGSLLGPM